MVETRQDIDAPALSVILPVRDSERFLDEAVASVLGQTETDFEVIAVDDGSSDSSVERLKGWAARDPRLKVHVQQARGVAAALNQGLALARAPVVAIMHADDVARPDRFAKQLRYLAAHPSVALVGSAYDVVDANGKYVKTIRFPTEPAEIAGMMFKRNCIAHPTVMARREVLLAAGGYRPAFAASEDYDLWLRVAERGDLANLPDVTLSYRRHGHNASLWRLEQEVLCHMAAQAAARARRSGQPDPTDGCTAITRETLLALGIPKRVIDTRLWRHALGVARLMRRLGNETAARSLVALARQYRPPLSDPAGALRFAIRLARTYS